MPSCSSQKAQESLASGHQPWSASNDWHRSRCAGVPVDAVNGELHVAQASTMEGSESYSICPSLENGVGGAQGTSGDGERARKQSVVVMSSTTERGQVDDEARCHRISGAVKVILQELGIDLARCNLQDTPERYARALLEFTSGYAQSAEEILSGAVFPETYSDMIVERDIDIWSLCEHHMVPFFGKCHIAYIPQGRILGLSKLARVAEMYARRLQVQERLTRQIADCIEEYLHPRGVAVYIEATHLCMSMRGIRKTDARTTTITTRGVFAEDRSLQEQFLDLVNR